MFYFQAAAWHDMRALHLFCACCLFFTCRIDRVVSLWLSHLKQVYQEGVLHSDCLISSNLLAMASNLIAMATTLEQANPTCVEGDMRV